MKGSPRQVTPWLASRAQRGDRKAQRYTPKRRSLFCLLSAQQQRCHSLPAQRGRFLTQNTQPPIHYSPGLAHQQLPPHYWRLLEIHIHPSLLILRLYTKITHIKGKYCGLQRQTGDFILRQERNLNSSCLLNKIPTCICCYNEKDLKPYIASFEWNHKGLEKVVLLGGGQGGICGCPNHFFLGMLRSGTSKSSAHSPGERKKVAYTVSSHTCS